MHQYWPGTRIPKSSGNAFDWKRGESTLAQSPQFKAKSKTTRPDNDVWGKARTFTVYSKAKAAK